MKFARHIKQELVSRLWLSKWMSKACKKHIPKFFFVSKLPTLANGSGAIGDGSGIRYTAVSLNTTGEVRLMTCVLITKCVKDSLL